MSYVADNEPRDARRWHGWIWDTRRSRWDHVCTGESLPECSRKLSSIVDARRTKDCYTCLTSGACPTFRPGQTH